MIHYPVLPKPYQTHFFFNLHHVRGNSNAETERLCNENSDEATFVAVINNQLEQFLSLNSDIRNIHTVNMDFPVKFMGGPRDKITETALEVVCERIVKKYVRETLEDLKVVFIHFNAYFDVVSVSLQCEDHRYVFSYDLSQSEAGQIAGYVYASMLQNLPKATLAQMPKEDPDEPTLTAEWITLLKNYITAKNIIVRFGPEGI